MPRVHPMVESGRIVDHAPEEIAGLNPYARTQNLQNSKQLAAAMDPWFYLDVLYAMREYDEEPVSCQRMIVRANRPHVRQEELLVEGRHPHQLRILEAERVKKLKAKLK